MFTSSAEQQLRRIRTDAARAREALDRRKGLDPTPPGFLPCITTHVGTYPMAGGKYFYVYPIYQTGDVAEGVAVDFSQGAVPFLAGHLGTGLPAENTVVMVFQAGGRHLFQYYGP